LLPNLGVNRYYPLDLQHAPPKFHVLGLPHSFWEQGIAALKLFLEFGNTAQPEHMLIQTSLEYLQLAVGMGAEVLQADFSCGAPWPLIAGLNLYGGLCTSHKFVSSLTSPTVHWLNVWRMLP